LGKLTEKPTNLNSLSNFVNSIVILLPHDAVLAMLCCTMLQATASVTACAEQCSLDRSPGAKMIPRQPVVEDVTLAAEFSEQQLRTWNSVQQRI